MTPELGLAPPEILGAECYTGLADLAAPERGETPGPAAPPGEKGARASYAAGRWW